MKKSTKFLTKIAVLLFLVFAISSCNNEAAKKEKKVIKPTFDLTNAKVEIESANKNFRALFAAADSLGLANLYTHDAKFMNNGAPSITGRKNIQSALSGIISSGISDINLATTEVWGMKNLITEEGKITLFVDGASVYQGKYIVLWKKVDGKWKLFRDIFNSDLPAK